MNRKKKIERFIALMLALMLLAALLPAAACTESDMDEYYDVQDDPDVCEETEETHYTEDEHWAEDVPVFEADNEVLFGESIEGMIAAGGYVYIMTTRAVMVYGTPKMAEPIFTITQDGAVLLATEYRTKNGKNSVKVWFITEGNEVIAGYAAVNEVEDTILLDEEAFAMADILGYDLVSTDAGDLYAFAAMGEKPGTTHEVPAVEANAPMEDFFISNTPIDDEEVISIKPMDMPVFMPIEVSAPAIGGDNDEPDDDVDEADENNDPPTTENPVPAVLTANIGDYIAVTPNTRVFLGIDETASDAYLGDLCVGVFVNDAAAQVTAIEQDNFDSYWFKVRYIFGNDNPDGTMAWVDDGFVYVLAAETDDTAERECSVTDYAFSSTPVPKQFGIIALAASPMIGFSLKTIYAPIGSFWIGQTGVHGDSHGDRDYPPLATSPGHGTIYATPHYLNGYIVYCLEHTMNSPGGSVSGESGNWPTGPYTIVDLDGYRTTPGYYSTIFKETTMHAIAWVMRHSYPFMALDRNDSDNLVWSRAAGQYAIREVVKQMEGPQHVRDYWQMDTFYAGSGNAPAVYLTYARWLASNAIAYGQSGGNVTATGKSVAYDNGLFVGTVTFWSDADLIRISRSVSLTGNTAGQDGSYYYLNSGDTVTVSSTNNPFSIVAESIPSDADEAYFLVGVSTSNIQRVLIPQVGSPYPFKSSPVEFHIPFGFIYATKKDVRNGAVLAGVVFELLNSAGTVVQTKTTGSDGMVKFLDLLPGSYTVREKDAPLGYVVAAPNTQSATVTPGVVTNVTFSNRHVTVKLKLYKRDIEEYGGAISNVGTRGDGVLTGAEFQVRAGENITDRQGNLVYAKGAVVVASIKTTGADASVTTDELWPGLYEIVELTPPVGYQPSDVSVLVDARGAASQNKEAVITYEGLRTNKIHYGALAIVKFLGDNQEHTGAGLIEIAEEGAEFEVYLKRSGSYDGARDIERDYLITDDYGRAKTKALPYGVYVLRQTVGQEGHAMQHPIEFMINGAENLQSPPTLILNNQARRYRLRIIKIDEETGNTITLADTSFRLRDADGNIVKQSIYYPVHREIDTFLTDENGEVTLPETVAWGQYFIEEVQSPEGYVIRTEPISVFVGHAGDSANEVHEIAVEFPNEPVKGHIVLDKKGLQLVGFETMTDVYGNEYEQPIFQEGYLEGAVFEVRAAEDVVGKEGTVWYRAGDLVDTIVTTASGSDQSMELPLGKYWLLEIEAPVGYVYENVLYEANLVFADNQTPRVETIVEVGNEYLPAQIILKKEKEITSVVNHYGGVVRQIITKAPGEGFVFGLYNAEDIIYPGGTLMAGTLVATGTTGDDGFLMFSGHYPHGRYYIMELSVPKGWRINPERFGISLDPARKADDADVIRAGLPNAVLNELIYTRITLTKTDITGENTLPGAVIEVKNSDDEVIYRAWTDENGHTPDIPITPGVYTFHEVFAPEGYALSEAVMTFTVDEAGNVTGDTTVRDDYTRFSLLKQGENNQPLAGVEFALMKEDGTLVQTAVTDENGLVAFEKVPYGNYTIVETKPLPGYFKNDTKVQLTVDGYFINPSEPVATLVNRPIQIIGMKVDTSGEYIPGVEFSLIDTATGEIVESVTSNDDGEFILTKLDYGDWIIRETIVPEGYSQMEDIPLCIDESWTEPVYFTFVNIPNHYEFLKTDHKDGPLAGVTFALEDADGNTLRELVSGEDGIVRVTELTPGAYVIREDETVEGFIRSDETIEIVVDENYVVPDEMVRLVNYPGIQTGFEFTMTPVMWVGVALVLAAAASAVAYGIQNKKKKRRRVPAKTRRI